MQLGSVPKPQMGLDKEEEQKLLEFLAKAGPQHMSHFIAPVLVYLKASGMNEKETQEFLALYVKAAWSTLK